MFVSKQSDVSAKDYAHAMLVSGQPPLIGHLPLPEAWPLIVGSTVFHFTFILKPLSVLFQVSF